MELTSTRQVSEQNWDWQIEVFLISKAHLHDWTHVCVHMHIHEHTHMETQVYLMLPES